ncbi:MAG: hypothetical protein AB2L07_19480 [Thermoanaerobaculaceae bacterium]
MSRWSAGLTAAGVVLALVACAPINEGPVLGKVPEGLAYTSTMQAARVPLPRRAVTRQLGYVRPGGADWTTSVVITEYSGATSAEEVSAARDEYARRYTSTEYSEIEGMGIDGRPAWGWYERQRSKERLVDMQLTAVVAYPSASYSIEVSTSDPRLQSEGTLREVALSFRIATRERFDAAVLIVAGLLLGAVTWVVWRASQTARTPAGDTVDRLLR